MRSRVDLFASCFAHDMFCGCNASGQADPFQAAFLDRIGCGESTASRPQIFERELSPLIQWLKLLIDDNTTLEYRLAFWIEEKGTEPAGPVPGERSVVGRRPLPRNGPCDRC